MAQKAEPPFDALPDRGGQALAMTLWDWYAGQAIRDALQPVIAALLQSPSDATPALRDARVIAQAACLVADAMIAARRKDERTG